MSTPTRKANISLLQRRWSALRVKHNQNRLADAAQRLDKLLLEVTKPTGCGGYPDRFYHFIFDLLLPLYTVVQQAPPSVKFAIGGLGPFGEELQRVFPNRVSVYESRSAKPAGRDGFVSNKLLGMNPRGVHLTRPQLHAFREFMFKALNVEPKPAKQILLIEREAPDSYYIDRGKSASGVERRSILNHPELYQVIQGIDRARDGLLNLQLENLDLADQMQLFAGSDLVIAQHGASLSNALWMAPGSHVVEISKHKSYNHFSVLCQVLGLHHHAYLVEGDHVEIDTEDFKKWLCAGGLDQR